MKSKEFHRLIEANGWVFLRASGSHYIYKKGNRVSKPVPYHGAKEMGESLRKKIAKEMGLE